MQAEMLMEAAMTSEHSRNDHRPDKEPAEEGSGSEQDKGSVDTNGACCGAEPSDKPPTDTCTRQRGTEPHVVSKLGELCPESTSDMGQQESTEEPHCAMDSTEGGPHSTIESTSPSAIDSGSASVIDSGSASAIDSGSASAIDSGSASAIDSGSAGASDSGSPGASDSGSPGATGSGSPGAIDSDGPHNAFDFKDINGDQPLNTTDSKEISDQPDNAMDSTEISDQPHNSMDYEEISDKPFNNADSKEINDQSLNTTDYKEISDQHDNTMNSKEITDQPHNTMNYEEISDQHDNAMESTEISDQSLNTTDYKEISDQHDNTMESTEISDQPPNTRDSNEISEQPHNAMDSKEITDQPYDIIDSKEISDQIHNTMDSNEICNVQPHKTAGCRETSDEPPNTTEPKEIPDQLHATRRALENAAGLHNTAATINSSDAPPIAVDSAESRIESNNTTNPEESSGCPAVSINSMAPNDGGTLSLSSEGSPSETEDRTIDDVCHEDAHSTEAQVVRPRNAESNESRDVPQPHVHSKLDSDAEHSEGISKAVGGIFPIHMEHKEADAEPPSDIETKGTCEDQPIDVRIHEAQRFPSKVAPEACILESAETTDASHHAIVSQENSYGSYVTEVHDTQYKPDDTAASPGDSCRNPMDPNHDHNKDGESNWETESNDPGVREQAVYMEAKNSAVENTLPLGLGHRLPSEEKTEPGNAKETSHLEDNKTTASVCDLTRTDMDVSRPVGAAGIQEAWSLQPEEEKLAPNEAKGVPCSDIKVHDPKVNEGSAVTECSLGQCVSGSRCPHEPPCLMPSKLSVDEARNIASQNVGEDQVIASQNGLQTTDNLCGVLGPASHFSLAPHGVGVKVGDKQHLDTRIAETEVMEIPTTTAPSAATPETNTTTETVEEEDLIKHLDTADSRTSPLLSELEDSLLISERQGDLSLQPSGQGDTWPPSPTEANGPVRRGSEGLNKSQGDVPPIPKPRRKTLPSLQCIVRPAPGLETVPADGGDSFKWRDTGTEHHLITPDPNEDAPSYDRSSQSPLPDMVEIAEDLPDAMRAPFHQGASKQEGEPQGWGVEHPLASDELPASFEDLIGNVLPRGSTARAGLSSKEWHQNEYSEVQSMPCPPRQGSTSSPGNVKEAGMWEGIPVQANVGSSMDVLQAQVSVSEEWGKEGLPYSQSLHSGWDRAPGVDRYLKADLSETFPLASGTDSTFPSEALLSEEWPADPIGDFKMTTDGIESPDQRDARGRVKPVGDQVKFMTFLSQLFRVANEEVGELPASIPGLAEAVNEAGQIGGGRGNILADVEDAEHDTVDGTAPSGRHAGLHVRAIDIPLAKKQTSSVVQFINPPAWVDHSPEETLSFFQADITADPLGEPMKFSSQTPVPFHHLSASLPTGASIPQDVSMDENEPSSEETPEMNLGFHSPLGSETPPMRDFSPATEDVFLSPQPPLTHAGVVVATAEPESHSNLVPSWKVPDESVIQMLAKKLNSPKLCRKASKVYKTTGGTAAGKEARHSLSTPVLVSHSRLAEDRTSRETVSEELRKDSTPLTFKTPKFMKFTRASPEAGPLIPEVAVDEDNKWKDRQEDPPPVVENKSGRWFVRVREEGAECRDRLSGQGAPDHPSVRTLHAQGNQPFIRSPSWPYDTLDNSEEDTTDPRAAESRSQEVLTRGTSTSQDWRRKVLRKPPESLAVFQGEDQPAEGQDFSTSDSVTLREKSSPSLSSNIIRRQSKLINSSRLLYQEYSDVALNHEIQRQKRAETFMEESEPSSPRLRRKQMSQQDSYLQRLSVSSSASLWQEIPMIRGSSTLLSMTREEQKLQEAKFELIMSEASYLRSLNIAVDHFQHSPDLQALLSNQARQWLFSRLQEVRDVSSNFLFDLEEKFEDNIYTFNVCDVVLSHAPELRKVYLPYVTNQSYQEQTFRQLLSENPKFQQVLERLEGDPVCQRLSLKSFLILPFQRITRLKLLVQNILKRTRPGSREETQATQAYNLMEKLIKDCNENVQQMRSTEELIYLSQKIQFECKIFPLISQSRRLVKHGELVELEYSSSLSFKWKVSTRPIYLHLFNDYLLLSRRRDGTRFLVFDHARRSKVRGEKCEVKLHDSNKNIFRLILQENNQGRRVEFLFRTETQSEKLRWISALSPPRKEPDFMACHDNPQVQCLKSYKARENDELSLEKADVIMVTQKSKDGWMEGMRLSDGERGWFPVENVEDISNKQVRLRNLKEEQRIQTARAKLLPPPRRR